MKVLWRRERRYVAIPNMEVWLRLARLAPDVPDGWSFADVTARLDAHICLHGKFFRRNIGIYKLARG